MCHVERKRANVNGIYFVWNASSDFHRTQTHQHIPVACSWDPTDWVETDDGIWTGCFAHSERISFVLSQFVATIFHQLLLSHYTWNMEQTERSNTQLFFSLVLQNVYSWRFNGEQRTIKKQQQHFLWFTFRVKAAFSIIRCNVDFAFLLLSLFDWMLLSLRLLIVRFPTWPYFSE